MLPSLVLRKPEVVIEKGDNGQLNWALGEAPAAASAAKEAIEPDNRFETPLIGRLEVTDGKLSYRDPKRKLELDGTVSTAMGKAGEQPQAELELKGKLEGQPLTLRFVGGSVVMLRDTEQPYPLDLDVTFGATKLKAKGTVMDPFQWTGADVQLSLSGPRPRRHLSAARHPRPGHAALQHHRQAASRIRRLEVHPKQVARWRQRSHRRGRNRRTPKTRPSDRQARVAEAGLRRPGAVGRRAARQAWRQCVAPAAPDPAAARGDRRSLPQRAAQGREAAGDEHGRHARRQADDRARLPAGAGLVLPRRGAGRRGDGQAAHPDPAGRRPERGRRQDRGRAGGRRQDRHAQGAHQPGAERHRAAQLLPPVTLLRRHLRQGAGPRRAGRHRPLAGPGHGDSQRPHRGGAWAAARSPA